MKKNIPIFIFILLIVFPILSCNFNAPYDEFDVLKNLGFWESQSCNSGANTVVLEVTRDIDYLFWTKSNGEVLDSSRENGKEKLAFKKGTYTFTFKEPGIYVLNIYQKPKDDFNKEDNDFRGLVEVFHGTKIKDTGYAGKCTKQARYMLHNDSKQFQRRDFKIENPAGNQMSEFIYVYFEKSEWDRSLRKTIYTYNTKFKYKNFNLQPDDYTKLLLPMETNDVKKGGFILKPVIVEGKTYYYGHTGLGLYKFGNSGHNPGMANNDFKYIGNNRFQCVWK